MSHSGTYGRPLASTHYGYFRQMPGRIVPGTTALVSGFNGTFEGFQMIEHAATNELLERHFYVPGSPAPHDGGAKKRRSGPPINLMHTQPLLTGESMVRVSLIPLGHS